VRIFDRSGELMDHDLIEQVHLERLQALVARLKRNVRRWRERLAGIRITGVEDLDRLPFTSPQDLLEAFPYGMFALPLREVVRLHSTVGPGGKPLVLGYSRNDLTQWARLTARQLVAAGVTSNDVIQISFGGGFFNEALGYMLGAELVGASVIPEDPFHIEYQLEVLQKYRTTVLVTTPTNARDLADLLQTMEIDPQSLHLRTLVLSRPIPDDQREHLEVGTFAEVRTGFGVPEVMAPGFALECDEHRLHVQEDQFLVEVLDGELVVTTLVREAMPLLRYRTRIAARLERGRCPCGRTGVQVLPDGRLDGRLLVNEMPLCPEQIDGVLARTKAAGQPFRLHVSERGVIVEVEVSENFFADEMRVLADLKREIRLEFLARLGVEAEVRYVSSVGDSGNRGSAE